MSDLKKGESLYEGFAKWNNTVDGKYKLVSKSKYKSISYKEKIVKNINYSREYLYNFNTFKEYYVKKTTTKSKISLPVICVLWILLYTVPLKGISCFKLNEPGQISIYLNIISITFGFIFCLICKEMIFAIDNNNFTSFKNKMNNSLNFKLNINDEKVNYMLKPLFKNKLSYNIYRKRKIHLINELLENQSDVKTAIITLGSTIVASILIAIWSIIGQSVDEKIVRPAFENNRQETIVYEIYDSKEYKSKKEQDNTEEYKSKKEQDSTEEYKSKNEQSNTEEYNPKREQDNTESILTVVKNENAERKSLSISLTIYIVVLLATVLGFVFYTISFVSIKYNYYKILRDIKLDLI